MTLKKRVLSLFLTIMVLATIFAVPTQAATSSWRRNTSTIWVQTTANYWIPGSASITLKQDKGTISYIKTGFWGKPKGTGSKKLYGSWVVYGKSTDGKHTFTKTLGGSSLKLNLKPNKSYNITIRYNYNMDTIIGVQYRNAKWTTEPGWHISGSWKVKSFE